MKRFLLFACINILFICCKSGNKEKVVEEPKELTIAEKIANAHGIRNWDNVSKIDFTFNVDRSENHFERSWQWEPKKNTITMISSKDTVRYNRMKMDSIIMKTDGSFINDKYWLLAPFNLIWDEGTTISEPAKEIAPISKEEMHKITLTYTGDGGYTPGDAYDFYYGDDFLIKEWIFRKGNAPEPSLVTTYEEYKDFNGIKIATAHTTEDKNFKLYFTNVNVVLE